jgi:hypothetical protein
MLDGMDSGEVHGIGARSQQHVNASEFVKDAARDDMQPLSLLPKLASADALDRVFRVLPFYIHFQLINGS